MTWKTILADAGDRLQHIDVFGFELLVRPCRPSCGGRLRLLPDSEVRHEVFEVAGEGDALVRVFREVAEHPTRMERHDLAMRIGNRLMLVRAGAGDRELHASDRLLLAVTTMQCRFATPAALSVQNCSASSRAREGRKADRRTDATASCDNTVRSREARRTSSAVNVRSSTATMLAALPACA
jgi:hypothetical protein